MIRAAFLRRMAFAALACGLLDLRAAPAIDSELVPMGKPVVTQPVRLYVRRAIENLYANTPAENEWARVVRDAQRRATLAAYGFDA